MILKNIQDDVVKKIQDLAPYIIVALMIVLRNEQILFFRAEFWAEDCSEFFVQSIEKGFKSLFIPIWGYHFFLGRLVAYAATFFPVLWSPSIYIWSALFFNAIALGYFSRDGFSWIIKSKILRVVTCALIATGPGSEVFYGLCVMYSPLVLLGLLILLEQPWELSYTKISILIFLSFSSGAMFSSIPVAFYLFCITRKRAYLFYLVFIFGISLYNVSGTTGSDSLAVRTGEFNINNLLHIPEIVIKNFYARLFVVPFWGNHSLEIIQNPIKFLPSILLFVLFIIYFIKRKLYKNQTVHILLLVYLSTIGILGVTALVRNYAIRQLLMADSICWGLRYFFLPGVFSILFWCYLLFGKRRSRNKLIVLPVISLFFVVNGLVWKSEIYYRNDLRWELQASQIQNAVDERKKGIVKDPVRLTLAAHPHQGCSLTIQP